MSSTVAELRILIVADDPLTRAGLAALLSNQPTCRVVGQAPVDSDLATLLAVYLPDVVLWDLGWAPEASLENLADLTKSGKPIVALLPDDTQAAYVWSSGARGLLLRDADAACLISALQAVSQELIVLDPGLAGVSELNLDLNRVAPIEKLTPRETDVLKHLAGGLSNKAIAYELGISEHTVKFHVNAIMGKLGAQSRTEAAVRATQLGLILL